MRRSIGRWYISELFVPCRDFGFQTRPGYHLVGRGPIFGAFSYLKQGFSDQVVDIFSEMGPCDPFFVFVQR